MKTYLQVIKGGACLETAELYEKQIRRGIAEGQCTWEELGVTSQELSELVASSELVRAKRMLADIKEPGRHQGLADGYDKVLRDGIAAGRFGWEQLGITSDELHELVKG